MSNYKSIRLEEPVYNDLAKRQLPRESISQTLERLLLERKKFEEVIDQLYQFLYGGEPWNTKR